MYTHQHVDTHQISQATAPTHLIGLVDIGFDRACSALVWPFCVAMYARTDMKRRQDIDPFLPMSVKDSHHLQRTRWRERRRETMTRHQTPACSSPAREPRRCRQQWKWHGGWDQLLLKKFCRDEVESAGHALMVHFLLSTESPLLLSQTPQTPQTAQTSRTASSWFRRATSFDVARLNFFVFLKLNTLGWERQREGRERGREGEKEKERQKERLRLGVMSRRFVVFEDPVLARPAGKLGPSASALSSRLQALRDVTNTKQQKSKGEAEKGAPTKQPLFLTVRQVRSGCRLTGCRESREGGQECSGMLRPCRS